MAGAIDLFSGNDPVAGINLFKVDKSPLDRLDQGIVGMISQAESAAGAITDLIQAIIDAILGWAGGTLADLAEFFLNLGPNFVKLIEGLTGLNIDQGPVAFIQSIFVKLEAATGLNWDEGPVRFLTSLFDAIIGQLERLTGLNFGDGPVGFFNGIFLKLEAATGLDWNSGPLAFLASLFDGIWTQLNIATDLVWDEGPIAFIESVLNKLFLVLEELTGLELNSGLVPFLQSVVVRIGQISAALTQLWQTIFNAILNIVEGITGLELNSGILAFLQSLVVRIEAIIKFFTGIDIDLPDPVELLRIIVDPIRAVINFFENITGLELDSGIVAFLQSLAVRIEVIVKSLTGLDIDLPDPAGFLGLFFPIFDWLTRLWEDFSGVVEDVFTFVISVFQPMAGIFNGNVVGNIIKQVVEFFNDIIGTFGSIAQGLPSFNDLGQFMLNLINAITGGFATTIANGIATVINLFAQIPLLKPFIDAFIPPEWRNAVAQPASSLADLKSYATELIKTDSVVYSQNLYGQIPADLLPPTGSGDVADFKPNLVADPSFRSAAAVQAGEGWSWDSTTSRTPGDGGSAKLTGDGGVKQMFSNKVAVSPGQEIEVSVYAKWTKPSAARPTIGVGLRAYNGETVLFTNSFGLQSSVVTDSSGVTGQVSGWVQLKGTYAIPLTTPMTHVRLSLSVLNAPAGTSVWFDEASLRKVSLIRPALVGGVGANSDSLADDIENAVGVEQYQELLDRVAKKTGATLADVQATIEDFLDGDSEISGNQITSGQIASRYINELIDTWNKINGGINGPTAYADGTIDSAFVALTNFRENFTANGTKINEATTAANNALGRTVILERSYKELYDYAVLAGKDARAAAIQAGLVPQTPINPPSTPTIQFREASDSFNRTDLGSAWTTSRKFNNLAAFVLDGNNVRFKAADITTVDSIGAAVHTGGGGLTDYQRVYAVLGSSPGVPLLGTPGYNDLIGRAASGTSCIVARFYGTNIVRLFYRNAGWEAWPWEPATTFGTFSLPAGVSVRSGAMIELYVGNKSISDQTKCSVRVGSWASPVATLPASILPVLGRGWGFGGGNGQSFAAAQQSALFDSWGAQDQV